MVESLLFTHFDDFICCMALPPVFSEDTPIYRSKLLSWISNSDFSTFTESNCPTVASVNVPKLSSLSFPFKLVAFHTLLILRISSTSPQLLKPKTWKLCLTLLLMSLFLIYSNSPLFTNSPSTCFSIWPYLILTIIISLLGDPFENLLKTTNSTFPPQWSSAYTLSSSFWRLNYYLPMKATLPMFESCINLFQPCILTQSAQVLCQIYKIGPTIVVSSYCWCEDKLN